MCEQCKDSGIIEINKFNTTTKEWYKDIVYCVCEKGKKLAEIEKKREQKGFNDNY